MRTSDEKRILNTFKLGPLGVLFFTIIITILIVLDDYKNLNKEITSFEENYIKEQKVIIKKEVNRVYNYINYEKKNSEKKLKENLKERVYEAHAIASNLYSKYKEIKSQKEITNIIKEALRDIRFNKDRGYYYILTSKNAINILNGFLPSLEGKNLYNLQDSKGKYLNREIIKVIKDKGEGFVNYFWYKPNSDKKMYKKITFSKEFEPYSFYIGTGEYLTDYEENLKKEILNYVSTIKYGKNGYIFINSFIGVNLAHVKQSFRGRNFNNLKDPNGIYSVRELNKIAKKGEGYLEYLGQIVPSTGKKGKKISFAKGFKDWEWTIGSGAYLVDMHEVIEKRKVFIKSQNKDRIIKILIVSILTIILFFIIATLFSKKVQGMFKTYSQKIEKEILKNIDQKQTLLKAQKVAHIGDWKLDLKTKKTFFSNEVIRIFGVSRKDKEKFNLKYLKDLILEKDISCFENSMEQCIKEGKEHSCVYRINKPDGDIKWIDCRGKIDKEKRFIIGTIQDITDNKKLELEKKQQEEVLYQQSKLAAMGEMIGNIAHQWRQPLSTISTAATGAKLQKEMNILSDDNFNYTMDSINESAQYLSQTIDDFRGFFDIKNSVKNEFKITNTIKKTLNLVSSQFTAKEIEIIQNIEDVSIISLENELIQVFINILNNSRDALIKIDNQKKLIFINAYVKNKKLTIEIKDNAKGIPEDIITRVFEPYFTTKHKSQGTGIGLYMSESIVTTHLDGIIIAKNETYNYKDIKYTGAMFVITIPI
jgi:PAS domain S-box-containing protein